MKWSVTSLATEPWELPKKLGTLLFPCTATEQEVKRCVLTDEQMALMMEIERKSYIAPEMERLGLVCRNATLLAGPSGTGKSLFARVLGKRLFLPTYALSHGGLMSGGFSKAGERIGRIFQFVQSNPCVLIIDEIDALCSSCAGEGDSLYAALLQGMETITSPASVIVATTNRSDVVGLALLRRFQFFCDFNLPDEAMKRKIREAYRITLPKNLQDVIDELPTGSQETGDQICKGIGFAIGERLTRSIDLADRREKRKALFYCFRGKEE